jgi:surface protein
MMRSKFLAFKVLFSLLAFSLPCASGFTCYSKVKGRCCFKPDGDELRRAVSDFCDRSRGGVKSTAALTYGTVIGDWCVDYVQDFSNALSSLDTFNEPLTNWNTSSAINMQELFHRNCI